MREYSEKFHEISCWHEHPDDYENILLDFLKFLEVNILLNSVTICQLIISIMLIIIWFRLE